MKTRILFQSSLLAAGLLLGGNASVLADSAYTIILQDGEFHRLAYNAPVCRHTGVRNTWHHHHKGEQVGRYNKWHGKRFQRQHGHHDRGDRYGHGGQWPHGKLDDRNSGGNDRQRARSGGFGYTGRS
jgi:hypothetical protein